ncbi:L,D-transpeptidase family protein [Rhodopseudomonas palustris]|uniref:L,D-transpeptidase family protein n=1 Tax=Rhodopseudomonas palustris TaxID=1076 RepID=UPI0021F29A0A|nr:L,D-transpeptidase family protein [Rhodopseudomonas palustris]UYO43251.1 L,D-transpeptidase family protein [Rhodopseudomonas palustris]
MRSYLVSLTGLILLTLSGTAQAKVAITVDKDNQQLTVAVDGVERYRWPVSTGNPSHETPNGKFQTFRMEADHYSKEFDDAPMPHSIFFTKQGHAIHGTDASGKLGVPVSHGCVRLSRANAATLYALVEKEGVLNTTVTLTGSSQVALARLKSKGGNAIARAEPAPAPVYDSAGAPVELAPSQPRVVQPQVADDGYIYPADGSYGDRRYPAPPGYRRVAPPQYGYVENDSYAQDYAPRRYYQPRGYYDGGYGGYSAY